MIAIFAAMQVEVEACLACLTPARPRTLGRFAVMESDVALVCRTGIGRAAEEATRLVIEELSPRAVLSVGTAGGLNEGLEAGDLVLCERVDHLPDSPDQEPVGTVTADPRLLRVALAASADAGISVLTGGSVTVDTAAWGPQEKRRLRQWRGHDIVEMESFWVGRAAARQGIPFLAIRAVSDGPEVTLPEIPGLINDDGTVNQTNLLAYTREHPEVIPLLAAQHQRGGLALNSLRTLLDEFVPVASRLVGESAV